MTSTKTILKQRIIKDIGNRRNEIITFGESIYKKPETGFKEFATAGLVAEKLRGLGVSCIELKDIPGVKATIDTGREGPGIAILGELDSIICAGHPDCDRETGAVHACGHNNQIAAMIGAVAGLLNSGAIKYLSGKIIIIAVPAEEYIEMSYRKELKERGVIRYLGGKPEFLYRGLFDDVAICEMIHLFPGNKKVHFCPTANGCISKEIRYIGKAAHAGSSPHEGINALYAANLGLMAINAIRETFREDEFIRVHPIITKGGDAVNVIPSEVMLETLIRGKSMDAITETNKKVNRALTGSAIALGAQVEIEDIPGYLPYVQDKNLSAIVKRAALELVDEGDISETGHAAFSTDLGDMSAIMPVMQIYTGGIEGNLHSENYRIKDFDTAYVLGAELLAITAVELLWGNAETALDVISKYKPFFKSRKEYFDFMDGLFSKKVMPSVEFE